MREKLKLLKAQTTDLYNQLKTFSDDPACPEKMKYLYGSTQSILDAIDLSIFRLPEENA